MMILLREILNWMDKAEIWLLFLFFGSLVLPFNALEQRMRRKRGLMEKPLGLPKGKGT